MKAEEIARRTRIASAAPIDDEFIVALTAAADQFIVARGNENTVIAGYHWFCDWGRDTMIALPGLTLTTGRATYWSRSRQEYWRKGDTSGHVQHVRGARLDCDGDTVLLLVDQIGVACHTGTRTCFDGRDLDPVVSSDAEPGH